MGFSIAPQLGCNAGVLEIVAGFGGRYSGGVVGFDGELCGWRGEGGVGFLVEVGCGDVAYWSEVLVVANFLQEGVGVVAEGELAGFGEEVVPSLPGNTAAL